VTRRAPDLAREAVAVLAERGYVADVDLDGKHLKVRWLSHGRHHVLTISRSPGDRRAQANSRAQLRRLLREEERAQ
jgi:hypothetical protein